VRRGERSRTGNWKHSDCRHLAQDNGSRRPSGLRFVGCVVALLCLAAGADAHEIGTTRVAATFDAANTFAIAITTDAGALLARLQAARRLPIVAPATISGFQQRFDELCGDIPAHLSIAFDERSVTPQPTCLVDTTVASPEFGLASLGVTVTLRGGVPAGARRFSWRYGLTYAAYALTVEAGPAARGPADRGGARAEGNAGSSPGSVATTWLEGNQASTPIELARAAAPPSRLTIARTYLALGFTHILPHGLDHILFVLGIFLLSRRLRPMLWQVSAFTLAHSITLGLTLYGVIALRPSIVEPMIALSIVYVAVENLVTSGLKPWRVALVFSFGLLHGMGFASVLRELALPRSEYVTGLIAFNAGVEAGQLTVLLTAFALVGFWMRDRQQYRRLVVIPGSAAIALTGVIWTLQRLAM
jgi:hypothetical protein